MNDKPTAGQIPGTIWVDADACPVKAEIYKVAERHGWTVQVVANDIIALPRHPLIHRVVVGAGFDAADEPSPDHVLDATATFKIIVNDVPLSNLLVTPYDRWEGYLADQQELLDFIAQIDKIFWETKAAS